jgi:drug/metabolite transporter (DMT)-like permease
MTAGLGPLVIGLVLLAALLHASWNAILKTSTDRLTTTCLMNLTGLVVGWIILLFVNSPAPLSWVFLVLSAFIHIGYFIFLLGSYRFGDLSQVYPLARGAAPLIVAVLSPWLVGERLSPVQFAGVGILCLGILSLAFGQRKLSEQFKWEAVVMAFATGLTIAAYTVADGLGVRHSQSPAGYIAWLFVLNGITMSLAAGWVHGRGLVPALVANWRLPVFAGLLSMLAYGIVIWCYSLGAIAPIAALRETSVVMAAAIGTLVLREPFGARRIVCASFCAIGIVAINLARA